MEKSHKVFFSQFNRILTFVTCKSTSTNKHVHTQKKLQIYGECTESRQTVPSVPGNFKLRVADSSAGRQKGKRKREQRQTERVRSAWMPTWLCWRRLSPLEAGCHSGTQRRSWPKPWGQSLTRPQWKPLCSSCGVLLHCPQPELSACTFTRSREACFTHSRGYPMQNRRSHLNTKITSAFQLLKVKHFVYSMCCILHQHPDNISTVDNVS